LGIIRLFSEYIKNIAFFLIFAGFIGLILPSSKHREFINLTLGFVLIFIVLGPLQYFIGGLSAPIDDIIDGLTNDVNAKSLSLEAMNYDDAQKQLVINEFKSSITEQLKDRVNSDPRYGYVSSDIYVSTANESFGAITGISLVLEERPELEGKKPFVRIEPVSIEAVSVFSPQKPPGSAEASDEAADIKKSLSDFYNLPVDNIHITVLK
jgi:stage III sporulation protein AF